MARPKFPNPHIYIFNSPGCHGHYLRYLIDKFSRRTPTINELPFNENGNSHLDIDYSGYAEFVHYEGHDDQKIKNSNVVKIIFPNDILYFERVAMNRAGDQNRDLHNLHHDISFFKEYNKEFYQKLQNLYKVSGSSVPKWLLRDAYKLGFLDWHTQGSVVKSKEDIQEIEKEIAPFNKMNYVEVNVFFTSHSLRNYLTNLSDKFDLDLDLTGFEEIHKIFMNNNKFIATNNSTTMLLDAVKDKINIEVPRLDILQQAYVYAMLEKQNDFITMPLTDYFFTDTQQIIDYIMSYPEHYKAMNPNLPKFNGIDNPFFLHRQKAK